MNALISRVVAAGPLFLALGISIVLDVLYGLTQTAKALVDGKLTTEEQTRIAGDMMKRRNATARKAVAIPNALGLNFKVEDV
jgi:hypothetical protein